MGINLRFSIASCHGFRSSCLHRPGGLFGPWLRRTSQSRACRKMNDAERMQRLSRRGPRYQKTLATNSRTNRILWLYHGLSHVSWISGMFTILLGAFFNDDKHPKISNHQNPWVLRIIDTPPGLKIYPSGIAWVTAMKPTYCWSDGGSRISSMLLRKGDGTIQLWPISNPNGNLTQRWE